MTDSADVHTFLTLPLVPFELSESNFFLVLRQRNMIGVLNNKLIEQTIVQTTLLLDELINAIRWLCHNKECITTVMRSIRFRETMNSPEVTLINVQHYIDKLIIPSNLPLPPTVLPTLVSVHFSSVELSQQLSFTECTLSSLVNFYLNRQVSDICFSMLIHQHVYLVSFLNISINLLILNGTTSG